MILVFLTLLASCSSSENSKLIIGTWHGVSWLIDGKPSNLKVESTAFSFNDKGEYTYEYAGSKEKGKYKVENDMLFTTPANQQEIMVKITKLTKDTLVFNMNRSGQTETLTLLRK
jgi:hypothetical protein